jgi:hypothetical protein
MFARPQKRDDGGGNVSAVVVDPEAGKVRLQLKVWEQAL